MRLAQKNRLFHVNFFQIFANKFDILTTPTQNHFCMQISWKNSSCGHLSSILVHIWTAYRRREVLQNALGPMQKF